MNGTAIAMLDGIAFFPVPAIHNLICGQTQAVSRTPSYIQNRD